MWFRNVTAKSRNSYIMRSLFDGFYFAINNIFIQFIDRIEPGLLSLPTPHWVDSYHCPPRIG